MSASASVSAMAATGGTMKKVTPAPTPFQTPMPSPAPSKDGILPSATQLARPPPSRHGDAAEDPDAISAVRGPGGGWPRRRALLPQPIVGLPPLPG